MPKVLIAEDNPVLTKILKSGMRKHADTFEVVMAKDGEEAIEHLKSEAFDLLVTDLQMPKVDGLGLLAYMNEHHPEIPCIVMTAHGTPQMRQQLPRDVLDFIEKPFEIDQLVRTMRPVLAKDTPGGALKGISTANFLQLIEMEQKTCLFEVESPNEKKGYFYFEEGVLFDAVFGDLRGYDAALELIPLENVKIRFRNVVNPKKKIARRIKQDLMAVIMEAMRLKDETDAGTGAEEDVAPLEPAPGAESSALEDSEDPGFCDAEPLSDLDGQSHPMLQEKAGSAAGGLENLAQTLNELRTVKGFKAAAILTDTGEILESGAEDPDMDLAYVAAMFNDAFLTGAQTCQSVGLEDAFEVIFITRRTTVIMRSSGPRSSTPFRLMAVLETGGNQALMKMKIEKLLPAIEMELA